MNPPGLPLPQPSVVSVPPIRWGNPAASVQLRSPGGGLPGRPPVAIPPVHWPASVLPTSGSAQPQRSPAPQIRRQAPEPVVQPLAALVGTTVAIGLTALYQNYNREPEVFRNRQRDHWLDEKETMEFQGLQRHKNGTLGFNQQITSQRPFIWVLTLQDEIYLMDGMTGDPKHSMAAGGKSLYSAGVGQWLDVKGDGQKVLTISNVTGHYHASYESLERAATAFRRAGHPVKVVTDRKGSQPRGYLWQIGRTLGLV